MMRVARFVMTAATLTAATIGSRAFLLPSTTILTTHPAATTSTVGKR